MEEPLPRPSNSIASSDTPAWSNRVSFYPIASTTAANVSREVASAAPHAASSTATAPYTVVSQDVTSIMPPGYTETETVKADGATTTVITNSTGGTVDTLYGTSTMDLSEPKVNVWA